MHASEMQAALTEIEIVSKDGRTEERKKEKTWLARSLDIGTLARKAVEQLPQKMNMAENPQKFSPYWKLVLTNIVPFMQGEAVCGMRMGDGHVCKLLYNAVFAITVYRIRLKLLPEDGGVLPTGAL